jgi:predicted transcriptional regulator
LHVKKLVIFAILKDTAMTAMQMNAKKLEIIGMVMNTDDEQVLSNIASCFRSSADYLRPMTMTEFHDKINRAEEDIAAGRVISHEDMGKWISELR